jgi:hypothetical protein
MLQMTGYAKQTGGGSAPAFFKNQYKTATANRNPDSPFRYFCMDEFDTMCSNEHIEKIFE